MEPIKILSDGTHLPAGSDRTDHVAVLLPQHGLMFTARVINAEAQRQAKLEEACKAVTCAGFSDWVMPEIEELQLVVDRTRYNPALDPEYFRDIPIDWLWSKTPAAWSALSAWLVSADYGGVINLPRYYGGFALAVRRAAPTPEPQS